MNFPCMQLQQNLVSCPAVHALWGGGDGWARDYSKIKVSTPVHQAVSVAVSPAPVSPAAPSGASPPAAEMLKMRLM